MPNIKSTMTKSPLLVDSRTLQQQQMQRRQKLRYKTGRNCTEDILFLQFVILCRLAISRCLSLTWPEHPSLQQALLRLLVRGQRRLHAQLRGQGAAHLGNGLRLGWRVRVG